MISTAPNKLRKEQNIDILNSPVYASLFTSTFSDPQISLPTQLIE